MWTDRQTDRDQAGWLAGRQADRQWDRQTCGQTDPDSCLLHWLPQNINKHFVYLLSVDNYQIQRAIRLLLASKREREREKGSLDSWLKLCVCTRGWRGGRWIFLSACCFSVCGMQLLTMRPSCSSGSQQMLKFMQLQCQ